MTHSTERQKAAVHYCEQWLYLEFTGDINNFTDCNVFLSNFLEDAKQREREFYHEYTSYLWDKIE